MVLCHMSFLKISHLSSFASISFTVIKLYGCLLNKLCHADLRTMSKRLESEQYYITFEMFVADVKRMLANARTYNAPETIYYKCATRYFSFICSLIFFHIIVFAKIIGLFLFRLESYFSNRVQAHLLQTTSKNP